MKTMKTLAAFGPMFPVPTDTDKSHQPQHTSARRAGEEDCIVLERHALKSPFALLLLVLLVVSARAAGPLTPEYWQVIYQQDFSTDPNWITDDPGRLQWDEVSRTFHCTQVTREGTYAYTTCPDFQPNRAWQLALDYRINSCDYAGGLTVGLYDDTLLYSRGAVLDLDNPDPGHGTHLLLAAPLSWLQAFNPQWQLSVWYRAVVTFDEEAQLVSVVVTIRDTGEHFWGATTPAQAPPALNFPTTMIHVGVSLVSNIGSGWGSQIDYDLDNIVLLGVSDGTDTTPPEILCPADRLVESSSSAEPDVTGTATAIDDYDPSPSISYVDTLMPDICQTTGVITRTWTATDSSGNSSSCAQTITVQDTTPPIIAGVSITPSSLWPPNHKMVDVAISAEVDDLADPESTWRIISVISNEPSDGRGDGRTEQDWALTGEHTLQLRAERAGNGQGRTYTIMVEATDCSGNAATEEITVQVQHDQGRGQGR